MSSAPRRPSCTCAAVPPSAAQSSARSARAVAGITLVAALGAAPRALALAAIAHAVPHAPLPQALYDFESMWGACKKPGAVFTGYSPGGQLYRWLILTDHVFYSLGLTVAYLCALHAVFPAETHGAREMPFGVRLWRGLHSLFYLLGMINFCVWMAIDAQLYQGEMTSAEVCARACKFAEPAQALSGRDRLAPAAARPRSSIVCICVRSSASHACPRAPISGRASSHAPQQCLAS